MIKEKIEIVKDFIEAYNSFDIDKMLSYLHSEIEFKNISNGTLDIHTKGINEFRELAAQSSKLFKEREQKIISYKEEGNKVTVEILYHAILAVDLPNGLKIGDSLDLKGKSEYAFYNHLIISIVDES